MSFNSYEFKTLAKVWNFILKTSSPHYSRSNGQAGSGVKIAKSVKNVKWCGSML